MSSWTSRSWPTKWATIRYSLATKAARVSTTEATTSAIELRPRAPRTTPWPTRKPTAMATMPTWKCVTTTTAYQMAVARTAATRPATSPPTRSLELAGGATAGVGRRLPEDGGNGAATAVVAKAAVGASVAVGAGCATRGSGAATISRAPPQL
jgi:hypothetical protein